jgi:tRNA nucleotidyltransferase/poly(A) polymerase
MAVLEQLWSAGHGAYLVGGGIRDALLGLPVRDWDVATDARPERILHLFPGSDYSNRFGTVLARGLEITTFRRDHRYADHRRPDAVTFSSDVGEDLARRDFTINAIAWGRRGPGAGAYLLDPTGGRRDLRERLVRAVGEPGRRFEEDALRLLRAVRIAVRLGFSIEPRTRKAMVAHAGDIGWVSEERVGDELRRMLGLDAPARAVGLLHEIGLLAGAVPELAALSRARLARALDALEAAASIDSGGERVRLAALLAEVGPEAASTALARLHLGGREAEAVVALITAAGERYAPDWTDARLRRYMSRTPDGLLDDLLALRGVRAEAAATAEPDSRAQEAELRERISAERGKASPLRLSDLAVDGHDLCRVLGLSEGPLIGRILEQLLADVLEQPALNTRSTLLARASRILESVAPDAPGSGPSRAPIR